MCSKSRLKIGDLIKVSQLGPHCMLGCTKIEINKLCIVTSIRLNHIVDAIEYTAWLADYEKGKDIILMFLEYDIDRCVEIIV